MDSDSLSAGPPRPKRYGLVAARDPFMPGTRIKRLELMRKDALGRLEPRRPTPPQARTAP